MDHTRIAEFLQPFLGRDQLTQIDLDHISTYIDTLLRWNARINLTALRDPDEIVIRHFGESFFAARHLFPVRRAPVHGSKRETGSSDPAPSVIDLGSGAGFPGIPLKIWAPDIRLTLIEANHKKATFLREVARALGFTDIDVQTRRAEDLDAGTFELVTLRAVERFTTVLQVAARLLAPAGRLALLIGSSQLAQAQTLLPKLIWSSTEPMPQSDSRILAIGRNKPNQT